MNGGDKAKERTRSSQLSCEPSNTTLMIEGNWDQLRGFLKDTFHVLQK